MNYNPLLSIVSPVYQAEKIIEVLVSRISAELSKITQDYEIILVEDGSRDQSWNKISWLCQSDPKVKGIKLSRNFGQHYAISAGIDHASGEWVIVMDCDLQDNPREIPKLFEEARKGYDVVCARRQRRKHSFIKRVSSKFFYSLFSYLTGTKYDNNIANYGIYHRKVINAIKHMPEKIRFFPSMVKWVGFRHTTIDVEHGEREEGQSTYNFGKLLKLATDSMLAYSDKPLRIAIGIGLVIASIAILLASHTIYRAVKGEIPIMGYASIIVSIWFFSGLIIIFLGILGLYLGKTFEGVKDRPVYITSEKVNFES